MAKYIDSNGVSHLIGKIKSAISTAASTLLSDVSYDSTTYKIQKTKNGTTSDVVTLASVATSGSYTDLSNKPTIATPGDGALTVEVNGVSSSGTFTANQSGDGTLAVTLTGGEIPLSSTSTTTTVAAAVSALAENKADATALTDGSVTKVGTADVGSSTQPIYLDDGTPTAGSAYAGGTNVTLNGSAKGGSTASFYAPTGGGTSGYYLKSGGTGAAPTWQAHGSVASGNANLVDGASVYTALTNGTVSKIGTADVGTATKPIYLDSGVPTAGTKYAGGTLVTLNNSQMLGSEASFYAPTSAGSNGYYLVGTGANNAPTWSAKGSVASGNTALVDGGTVYTAIQNAVGDVAGALVYQGTLGTDGTTATLPANHTKGWYYIVATDGTYAGKACEVGDMVICNESGTADDNSHWDVIQTNIETLTTTEIDALWAAA